MLSLIPFLAVAQLLAFAPESKLWIEGDSNLHPWTCTATKLDSKIEIDRSAPQLARSLELLVEVDALDCGSGKMNDKMREALKSQKHPYVEFNLLKAEAVAAGKLKATGELSIAGQTHVVVFQVDVQTAPDGT